MKTLHKDYKELYSLGLFTHNKVARILKMNESNFFNWYKREFKLKYESKIGIKRQKQIREFLKEIENERYTR